MKLNTMPILNGTSTLQTIASITSLMMIDIIVFVTKSLSKTICSVFLLAILNSAFFALADNNWLASVALL